MNHDDWHFWVAMKGGGVTLPVFQSLAAFWPGLLSLTGDNMSAMKSIHNFHQVWKQYGFLPEFYNVAQNGASHKREGNLFKMTLLRKFREIAARIDFTKFLRNFCRISIKT